MNKIINTVRNWLGINTDMANISKDMHMLSDRIDINALNTFELFHGLPFASGVLSLTGKTAAAITQPGGGIETNSLTAILTGILLNARQGNSVLQIQGTLDPAVREALLNRGFEIEDNETQQGKSTHILWV